MSNLSIKKNESFHLEKHHQLSIKFYSNEVDFKDTEIFQNMRLYYFRWPLNEYSIFKEFIPATIILVKGKEKINAMLEMRLMGGLSPGQAAKYLRF